MKLVQIYRVFFIYFGCLLLSYTVEAQIANGTLYVTNQAQLDTLPYYEGIAGGLIIGRLDTTKPKTDITDLSHFRHLKWVLGNLTIYRNGRLQDLHGLDSLDEAGYTEITIEANDSLRSLEGLGRLKKTGESVDFQIQYNPLLESLHGLESIDSLTNNFYIRFNDRLKNLEGLTNVKYIDNFSVLGLEQGALETLYGLNPQVHIEDLTIGIATLHDLTGLDIGNVQQSLTVVETGIKDFSTATNTSPSEKPWFSLYIGSNPALLSLQGLDLHTNRGYITISTNPKLQDITLDHVAFGWPRVYIYTNPSLQQLSFASMRLLKDFWLGNNDSLVAVDCFPALDSIKGEMVYNTTGTSNFFNFIISGNERLKTIDFPRLLSFGSPDMLDIYFLQGMDISYNAQLERVSFPKMETILYTKSLNFVGLNMQSNPQLHRLEMPNLISLAYGPIQVYNADLEVLDGFNHMLRGGLVFDVGPHLKTVSGFDQLKVAYGIRIYGDSLQQLPDFPSLDSIGRNTPYGEFSSYIRAPFMKTWPAFPRLVFDNSAITDLSGNDSLQTTMTFPALKRVNKVAISSNNRLLSLDGFSTVEKVTTAFTVEDNAQLADCSAICAMLAAGVPPARFHLHNNAMECDTLPAVTTYCDTVSVAVGEPPTMETGLLSALRLSPNPATYSIHIGWEGVPPPDGHFDWTLRNVQGGLLQQGVYEADQAELSLANFPVGLYFLCLRDRSSGARLTRRFGVLRP